MRYGEISGDIILRDPYVASPPDPYIMDFHCSHVEVNTISSQCKFFQLLSVGGEIAFSVVRKNRSVDEVCPKIYIDNEKI